MTMYEIICDMAERHCKIKGMGSTDALIFDLESKSISCGKGFIIQKGKCCADWLDLTDGTFYLLDDEFIRKPEGDPYALIEDLYMEFMTSRPSAASSNIKGNFRARTSDELSFEQLLDGKDRILARYQLEALILLGSLTGLFTWENPKRWFWKSRRVPGLILYKSWLTNKEENDETNR